MEYKIHTQPNLSSSSCFRIGSNELFCLFISRRDGASERARNAKKTSAVKSPSLLHNRRDTMSVPYAVAREWVLIRSSTSAVVFDVENREKRGNDDKHHSIS